MILKLFPLKSADKTVYFDLIFYFFFFFFFNKYFDPHRIESGPISNHIKPYRTELGPILDRIKPYRTELDRVKKIKKKEIVH